MPKANDIWRDARGRERHVISVSPANVDYIEVVVGRANVRRTCLPVVWERWARKNAAKCIGKCG